ncbi:hypothetical protein BDY24DRAFT_124417 [Mrakia frigida]|uniref:uncharacterized protein n=1 Tax=Mrakia frigida TaxID=29902 RepID=UPI003FCC1E0D
MSLDSASSNPPVKIKREVETKRRASKASTSSTNSGHNVAGPSPSWQATPTPTSWGGRASSPHRLQQQQLRPPRPQTLQRRASEQSYYESSMASPLWTGNQQQLTDHQLQYQQQQPRGPHPIPNSSRRQPSPPSSAASSYEQQGYRPQPQYAPNGIPYPDTMPSVLARPIEMRRQSLQIGMERREPSPGSVYAVSPSRGSFPRNQRMYHPYAGGDGGQDEPFSAPMMKRRSTQNSGGRASPTSGRAFPASPPPTLAGLPSREDQHSSTEDISPTLEPEQDFAEYSYVPYDPHAPQPPPLSTLQQHQSPSQPHPLQHSQYQHPHPSQQQPSYFSGGPPPPLQQQHHSSHPSLGNAAAQPSPPLHHDQQQELHHDPYAQPHHQHNPPPQPYSIAPSPYPPQQHHLQQQYYDPSGRGPPQQAYDQYGRPMDPYAYQHQQMMDDRRFASGMVGGGGAMHSGVKEEDLEGYGWGNPGYAQAM